MKIRTYSLSIEDIKKLKEEGKIELKSENGKEETYKVLSDFAQIGEDFYMRGGIFKREEIEK